MSTCTQIAVYYNNWTIYFRGTKGPTRQEKEVAAARMGMYPVPLWTRPWERCPRELWPAMERERPVMQRWMSFQRLSTKIWTCKWDLYHARGSFTTGGFTI